MTELETKTTIDFEQVREFFDCLGGGGEALDRVKSDIKILLEKFGTEVNTVVGSTINLDELLNDHFDELIEEIALSLETEKDFFVRRVIDRLASEPNIERQLRKWAEENAM